MNTDTMLICPTCAHWIRHHTNDGASETWRTWYACGDGAGLDDGHLTGNRVTSAAAIRCDAACGSLTTDLLEAVLPI